jgi:hypothetical protein
LSSWLLDSQMFRSIGPNCKGNSRESAHVSHQPTHPPSLLNNHVHSANTLCFHHLSLLPRLLIHHSRNHLHLSPNPHNCLPPPPPTTHRLPELQLLRNRPPPPTSLYALTPALLHLPPTHNRTRHSNLLPMLLRHRLPVRVLHLREPVWVVNSGDSCPDGDY